MLPAFKEGEVEMDWEAVGAIAEACGALAVLATLIYLAVQIRQQNQVARAQVHQQRADSVIQLVSFSSSGENYSLFAKIMSNGDLKHTDFSEADQFRARLVLSPLRANLENTYEQYRHGFISEEHYQDVTIPLCLAYGPPLLEFGLPLTKSFKEELTRIIQNGSL